MRILILFIILLYPAALFSQDLQMGKAYHVNVADSLYAIGDYNGAQMHYKLALISIKNDAVLNYKLAKTYLKLNQPRPATKHLKRAKRIGYYRADLLLDSLSGFSGGNEQERELILKEMQEYYGSEPTDQ